MLRVFGGGLSANFWKLWISTAAANLADGITLIAIPLIALTLTRSPAEIAGVSVAAQIPMLFLGLIAGGLADRLDRRWTMFTVQLLRVAVIGALTVLAMSDALSMPIIYAAAFIIGAGEAFFDTNAQSILPAVVGKDRLVTANGRLFAAETVMNSFVGPPLGGLLIALSVPLALGAGAVGYALAAVGLLLIIGSFRAEREGPSRRLHVEIGEGIGYLLRHPLLLTLSSMVALGRLGYAGFVALLALYAVAPGPMGLSEPGYGLLLVTGGLGSLAGSFVTGRAVERLGRPGVLIAATIVFSATMLVPAVTAEPIIVGVAFFIGGMAIMSWNVTNVSLRQSILPSALMGRVHATHRFIANAAGLVGAVAAGLVGEAFGLPAVFAIGAGIVVLGVFGRFIVTEDRIRAAEATGQS
ncbi:MAG: MFS transporter [Chloroflexi bacterium]|nr:MFS transporter [Chloroflexota bacterium]MBA3739724.1 MFS transporter [Chloroflexota bacterium]